MNLEALDLTVSASDGSSLQKYMIRKSLRKLVKSGRFEKIAPLFKYRYCAARMYLGDFSDYSGWEYRHEDGWSAEIWFAEFPIPKWQGHNCGTLLVRAEQGVGDEIFYLSILPECIARVDHVIVECDRRIQEIVRRSFPRITVIDRCNHWDIPAKEFIVMGDLLRVFRKDKKHFPKKPYLKIDESRVPEFEKYRGMTGVAWRGRQGSIEGDFTGMVSLQYGDQDRNDVIEPDLDLTNDLEGVFALCSVLGKVVCAPQTIMHIAGSIGKKVEVYIPTLAGEVRNQIAWDYPPGRSYFYKDTTVFGGKYAEK